ncbi:MAG: DNA polymerase III subunit gamma/tau [Lachnospiraceae bacterium]|nr:DNA polymerase III subunit gamma/tau [Lachnospiraceae bacterium]
MSYLALYRKFRPRTFDEVRGQDHIVTTLRNQITAGRFGHAYLFVGTRGTGKTTVAKILAHAVNCESPVNGSPCGECAVCKAIASGASLNIVELDAASNNGVDDVRQIIDEVEYSPTIGRYRVYIIDEVHMFTKAAFNALLKTLEEPPEHVIFILATTEVQQIPVTILSRCQRYDFHRITLDVIRDRLVEVAGAEGIRATQEAFSYIARMADGAMRDALSLLDQCAAFHYGEELTIDMVLDVLGAVEVEVYGRLLEAILSGDIGAALDKIDEAVTDGRDLVQYVSDFIWYLRNLMLIQAAGDASRLTDVSTDNREALMTMAGRVSVDQLLRYIRIFSELSSQIRYSMQKRILVETALIRLLRPQTEGTSGELGERIAELEGRNDRNEQQLRTLMDRIASGTFTAAPPSAAVTEQAAAEDRTAKLKELAKALPEEVRQVIDRRREIIARVESPALRAELERCGLQVDGSGALVVESDSPVLYKKDNDGTEGPAAQIRGAIADVIGRDVEVRIISPGSAGASGERLFSADDLFREIRANVEIED